MPWSGRPAAGAWVHVWRRGNGSPAGINSPRLLAAGQSVANRRPTGPVAGPRGLLVAMLLRCSWLLLGCVILVPATSVSGYRREHDQDLLDQYVEHVDQGRRQEGVYQEAAVRAAGKHSREGKRGKLNPGRFTVNDLESWRGRRRKRSVSSYEVQEVVDEGLEGLLENVGNVLGEGGRKAWSHTVSLDAEGRVRLCWNIVDKEIEFQVEAPTRGYVGVGFSPNGDMEGADIMLGWIDDKNGQAYVVDCHGTSKTGAPLADVEQNYEVLGGSQNDTHTTLRFRRSLDTCDKDSDMTLGSDTLRVIWAIHHSDPRLDATGQVHGLHWHEDDRGSHSLYLMNPPAADRRKLPPNTRHWDLTLTDFEVPDKMDTLYWCKIFKLPTLARKHHMIGYEPLLSAGRGGGSVHHMLIYECAPPPGGDHRLFQQYETHAGAACYSADMPRDWDRCLTPIVAWAVGSEGEFLPDHVGLPLAGHNQASYFMMEVHYDNPSFRRVKDTSGLRVFYTESLRPHDGGVLVNGITVTPLHIIPPRQPEYRSAGYCNAQCTQKMFPAAGIKVVSVVLHSHLAGKRLRLRHIRDGHELARIAEDDHYDFNYQQTRVLPQEVTIRPGDELITECVYQTPNRTEPTFGGYSTKQEMCLAFVLYYPRIPLAACYSMTPVKHFFESFGVREFYNTDMDAVERMILKLSENDDDRNAITTSTSTTTAPDFGHFSAASAMDPELNARAVLALKTMRDYTVETADTTGGLFGELVIKEPAEFRNKSFMSHLYDHPWDEMLLTQKIEASFYAGQHMVFCRKRDDSLAIPADIFNFPNFTQFPKANNTECQEKRDHLTQANSGALYTSLLFVHTTVALIVFSSRS